MSQREQIYENWSDDDLRKRLQSLLSDDTVWKVFEALRVDSELRARENDMIESCAYEEAMRVDIGDHY